MARYYVNKNAQENGDHEVHEFSCKWLPNPENRKYLGEFVNCKDAVREAKRIFLRADGCAHCCPACNKS